MGGSSNMVGGVSVKEHAVSVFLKKDAAFDKAREEHESASRAEDTARIEYHAAKKALAKAVGYEVGDEPVGILLGDGRLIRLYSSRYDYEREREAELCVSIEKVL